MKKQTMIINTLCPGGPETVVQALAEIEKRARSRRLDLTAAQVQSLFNECKKDGYTSDHGGGVVNSYGWGGAESSAILVMRVGDFFIVTVGRGPAPSGPHGRVGPSLRSILGCPWGQIDGRRQRLLEWSLDQLGESIPEQAPMRWEDIQHFIAQGVVNISEGITTIEAGSNVHRAMTDFCRLVSEGKVVYSDA